MALGLKIGLGLGSGGARKKADAPLCKAIKAKVCVTAKDGDTILKLAPHVIYKRTKKNILTLDAVLVSRNDRPAIRPSLRTYRVDDLLEIALTDEGFSALSDFEADDPEYAGRAICIIKHSEQRCMNGYVKFETADGEPVVVNVDRVNFVRRFRGGDSVSAVNFEKGNYIVVKSSLEAVTKVLAEGQSRSV